jgi:hypothetical protein
MIQKLAALPKKKKKKEKIFLPETPVNLKKSIKKKKLKSI